MLELKADIDGQVVTLEFEHSLLSLSKWESRTKKPFLGSAQKKPTEMIDYFEDMLVTPGVDRGVVYTMEPDQLERLGAYINESRTASSVPAQAKSPGIKETVTSELMYYWLTTLKIPFHPTETWHISRLMMLVQITNFKQTPDNNKRSATTAADWREMSARNREKFGSDG